jgi:hypothetical protein
LCRSSSSWQQVGERDSVRSQNGQLADGGGCHLLVDLATDPQPSNRVGDLEVEVRRHDEALP